MTDESAIVATEDPARQQGKSPQYVTAGIMYQAVIFVSLAMSLLTCFLYDRYVATKVAVFDLPGYLVKLKEEMANGKMTEVQMQESLDRVQRAVNSVQSNYVVISGDAVLGQPKRIQKLSIGPQ